MHCNAAHELSLVQLVALVLLALPLCLLSAADITEGTSASASAMTTAAATHSVESEYNTGTSGCQYNPCFHWATCIWNVTVGRPVCLCPIGFTGDDCASEIDYCDNSPCDPFGDCNRLVGNYSCTCKQGYVAVANNTQYCDKIDLCATSPCFSNGTCQDLGIKYKCVCPDTYVGLRCETPVPPSRPVITGISVTDGIIAGGAQIVITGSNMNVYPPIGAYFVDRELPVLFGFARQNLSSERSIVVVSPRANVSYSGRQLELQVDYSGPFTTNATLYFRYYANPSISDIRPRFLNLRGGNTLNVSGSNLGVVGNPTLTTTLVITGYAPAGSTVYINTTTTVCDNSAAAAAAADAKASMYCPLPMFGLPASLLAVDTDTQRNGLAAASVRSPGGNLTANLYLGLALDGFSKFSNISQSLPHINFTLVAVRPTFEGSVDAVVDYDPFSKKPLIIRGSNFVYGLSSLDYSFYVERARCVVDENQFTDSSILCYPPQEEPVFSNYNSSCRSKGAVQLWASVLRDAIVTNVYCIRYVSSNNNNSSSSNDNNNNNDRALALIALVAVVPIVAIVAIAVAAALNKGAKRRQRAAGASSVAGYAAADTEPKPDYDNETNDSRVDLTNRANVGPRGHYANYVNPDDADDYPNVDFVELNSRRTVPADRRVQSNNADSSYYFKY